MFCCSMSHYGARLVDGQLQQGPRQACSGPKRPVPQGQPKVYSGTNFIFEMDAEAEENVCSSAPQW